MNSLHAAKIAQGFCSLMTLTPFIIRSQSCQFLPVLVTSASSHRCVTLSAIHLTHLQANLRFVLIALARPYLKTGKSDESKNVMYKQHTVYSNDM